MRTLFGRSARSALVALALANVVGFGLRPYGGGCTKPGCSGSPGATAGVVAAALRPYGSGICPKVCGPG
jgi:hypothetical protein